MLVYLSVCLFACLLVSLSVCLFVYLTICLFVCLSICLFVCLSVCCICKTLRTNSERQMTEETVNEETNE